MENDLTTQSPTGNSPNLQEVLAGWLRAWARIYRDTPTAEDAVIYLRLLDELTPAQLDAACESATKECRYKMPNPADILAQVKRVEKSVSVLLAETEWERVLKYLDWYDPDTGTNKHDPPLPERTARATGDINALWHCSREELIWQKKGFLERYERLGEVEDGQKFLSDGMAKKLLRQLGEKPKQLAG